MLEPPVITLLRSGNRLVVDTQDPVITEELASVLRFTREERLFGPERKLAGTDVRLTPYQCYVMDHRNRVAAPFGFYTRIRAVLLRLGYQVRMRVLTPHPRPEVFVPRWERLYDGSFRYTLRHRQEEFLVKLTSHPCGRIDCPPGFGKSTLIGALAVILPKAKIHVVSDRVPVIRDRIYPELCGMLPDVGICGGGRKSLGHRVQLFTTDSLRHSNLDADFLIVDEAHEAGSDTAAAALARYDRSRNFGLSATHDMRPDGTDMRLEALFGPIIMRVSYQEAVEHGMVVPIRVTWHHVPCLESPITADKKDTVGRKRQGVWRHDARNQAIASVARTFDAQTQVLITCETIEHALALKALLPEYYVVYSDTGVDAEDRRYFERTGLWPPGLPDMTYERKKRLTSAFERGAVKKVIATTVWNVGVSFNRLQVLIRADAGGSDTMDTQIPGRTSRLHAGKGYGEIHDFTDRFDKGFQQRAANRRRNYDLQGWEQSFPPDMQQQRHLF